MSSRRLKSFIDTFVQSTEPLASPALFRRWTAITTISAACRQNVWVKTSHPLHPNLFVFLVAHPGVGKTRIIREAKTIASKVEGLHIAPVSLTFAALVDALKRAEVGIIRQPEGKYVYNSISIWADELGAFVKKYDPEMIDGLSAFYDPTPYSQERRVGEIRIEIGRPQVTILSGATPAKLMSFLPEDAWGQGFTSRVILVFSDQRVNVDDFAEHGPGRFTDLVNDLTHIANLHGKFTVSDEYRAAVNQWKALGEPPMPSHPRLIHYVTRRRVQLYKLSMISSIDRDDALILTEQDFMTAIEWLAGAESTMADIFKAGIANADSQAMDDIVHWIKLTDQGNGVSEHNIVKYARDLIPLHSILRIIEVLENSGQIVQLGVDKYTGARHYKAAPNGPTLM